MPTTPKPTKQRAVRSKKSDEIFFAALADGYSVSHAARLAGYSRRTVYDYRQDEPAFKQAWDDALEDGADVFEDELRRRAVDGIDKPVFYQGEICGHVREYSDTLLALGVKARRPEKYRENVDLNHSGNVTLNIIDYSKVADKD